MFPSESNHSQIQARGFAWLLAFRASDLMRCRTLARGAGRGCESPIIEPCVKNTFLIVPVRSTSRSHSLYWHYSAS
jgi:hypothetical protein